MCNTKCNEIIINKWNSVVTKNDVVYHLGDVGFSEVYKKRLVLSNLILTHKPIEVEENYINIFGHIHDKPLGERFNKSNHICVSCDVIDYTPIAISK